MIIQVGIGSSCHIKGSPEIVSMLQKSVEDFGLTDQITLAGSFCTGRCNRTGVTITVDDEVFPGITPATFETFFREQVLAQLKNGGGSVL